MPVTKEDIEKYKLKSPKEDTSLIIAIESMGNGALAHACSEAVTNYQACIKAANGEAWWCQGEKDTPETRISYEYRAERWEKYMRKLIATGKADSKIKPRCII